MQSSNQLLQVILCCSAPGYSLRVQEGDEALMEIIVRQDLGHPRLGRGNRTVHADKERGGQTPSDHADLPHTVRWYIDAAADAKSPNRIPWSTGERAAPIQTLSAHAAMQQSRAEEFYTHMLSGSSMTSTIVHSKRMSLRRHNCGQGGMGSGSGGNGSGPRCCERTYGVWTKPASRRR